MLVDDKYDIGQSSPFFTNNFHTILNLLDLTIFYSVIQINTCVQRIHRCRVLDLCVTCQSVQSEPLRTNVSAIDTPIYT